MIHTYESHNMVAELQMLSASSTRMLKLVLSYDCQKLQGAVTQSIQDTLLILRSNFQPSTQDLFELSQCGNITMIKAVNIACF